MVSFHSFCITASSTVMATRRPKRTRNVTASENVGKGDWEEDDRIRTEGDAEAARAVRWVSCVSRTEQSRREVIRLRSEWLEKDVGKELSERGVLMNGSDVME